MSHENNNLLLNFAKEIAKSFKVPARMPKDYESYLSVKDVPIDPMKNVIEVRVADELEKSSAFRTVSLGKHPHVAIFLDLFLSQLFSPKDSPEKIKILVADNHLAIRIKGGSRRPDFVRDLIERKLSAAKALADAAALDFEGAYDIVSKERWSTSNAIARSNGKAKYTIFASLQTPT